MKNYRAWIESAFVLLGHLLCRRRWPALLLLSLVSIAMISQLPKTRFDTSAEGLLHHEDPAIVIFDAFRDQFGSDQTINLLLEPPEIFSQPFLTRLGALHAELEQLPAVEKVTSLINVTRVHGTADELIIGELLDPWPSSPEELTALRQTVLADPLYRNSVISENGRVTTVSIRPARYGVNVDDNSTNPPRRLNEQERKELYDQVRLISDRYQDADFPVMMGGTITAEEALKQLTRDTMSRFTVITTLIIMLILAALFRRVSGVLLPLVIVNLALYCTLGLMAGTGVPFTLNSTVMPSLLLAVGIGDSVHLLAIFFLHYREHGDKEEAIAYSLGHSGLAVLMTSLTTAAGLMSFVSAGIAPIADLGKFAAIGVMLALFFTLFFLPVLLAILPIRAGRVSDRNNAAILPLDRYLAAIGDFAVRQPWLIITASTLLAVGSLFFAFQLRFTHNSLLYLAPEHPVRLAIEKIDQEMKGSITVEVIIDTGQEFGLHDPVVMKALDRMNRLAEQLKIGTMKPGKSTSVVDIVKEVNQALNEDHPAFFSVPDSREMIAQELLLFSNSDADDLDRLVDSSFSKARMTVSVPWVDAILYADILAGFEKDLQELLAGHGQVTVTGLTAIICRTFAMIIRTMGVSYLVAGVVITLFMILLIGDLKMGLLSMAPNFLPIIVGLGFMKIAGVPLDYSTIMVGGIAIGLAVDDTVHFFHNFRRYYDQSGDAARAVHRTMQTTGRAMLFTTIILSAAFFSLLAAEMKSTANFGLITGFTITFALLADFLLAPALLSLATASSSAATETAQADQ